MSFIDEVSLYLKAGSGGDGCASFRREKFIEFGGPDGGNGGKGGNVIITAEQNLNTLLDLRYKQYIKAENGKSGSGRKRSGAAGRDVILKVPVGTQIISEEDKNIIADLDRADISFLVVNGGKGGLGNINFKSSTNKAPRYYTSGYPGEEKYVSLQLKILSDVGIIGMPNAGKSSFLTRCTNADAKIANYPFTTIRPYIGIAEIDDNRIIIADIPGIVFNAHLGVGLGQKFLKHIERCKVLLHLIDATSDDVVSIYNCTYNELKLYNNSLVKKDEIVVLNKCDLLTAQEILDKKIYLSNYLNQMVVCLSKNDDLQHILQIVTTKLAHNIIEKYNPFKN